MKKEQIYGFIYHCKSYDSDLKGMKVVINRHDSIIINRRDLFIFDQAKNVKFTWLYVSGFIDA